MNTFIVYFSRTGNTKRLAQAIANTVKVPIFDVASIHLAALENCDLLIFGTPVEGASPAKEAISFIEAMSKVEGKKVILFCTYRLFGNNRAMSAMEKALAAKGYETLLKVSKKGMKPEKEADFSELLNEIENAIEKHLQ
jgi:flavodoxin